MEQTALQKRNPKNNGCLIDILLLFLLLKAIYDVM